METTRNDAETSSIPTKKSRCRLLVAVLCIVVSTLVFFGTVAAIVWLFEHNTSYKYSVVCFMAGSGMLYIVAFTSSLLLLIGEIPKRSISISREEPNVGETNGVQNEVRNENDSRVTDSVQNEVGSSTETASDISYTGGAQLLQLPERVTPVKTPPPPYKENFGISTAQNDVHQVQSTQASNNADNFPSRFYYELNRDEMQERVDGRQELMASEFTMEMQTVVKSHSSNGSLNHSKPITNALKQQIASNLSLLSDSSSVGHSPRLSLKVLRNPSQGAKRKLKAAPLSMSHSDLHSAEVKVSQSDCNADTRSLQHNFNRQGTPKIITSNVEGRTLQSILNPQRTPKIPRSNADACTSLLNLNLPGIPRIPRSNVEVQSSQSNWNIGEKQLVSRLHCHEEIVSSQSNLNPQGTPRIPRSKPDSKTSQSNLNPQGTPRIPRSNAEERTSLSNLSTEIRQVVRSDLNEEMKSSLTDLKPERTPRFSRSNLLRTSQMNSIPEIRLQTSYSNVSVDQKFKPESLSPERKGLDSKTNYLAPTNRQFKSHSNLHLNAQQSNSNANFYGLQRAPQVVSNSSASLNTSCSNMISEYLKQTSHPLKPFRKLLQPQQFVANSENVPKLQKAQSFTSLPVTNPLKQVSMGTVPERTSRSQLPNASSNLQMSGRSIESVLDASRTRQMTPEEWMKAWNNGFHKLPKEAENVVGVRI